MLKICLVDFLADYIFIILCLSQKNIIFLRVGVFIFINREVYLAMSAYPSICFIVTSVLEVY